jgi:ABC-type amino acid transport substrate-binding protein
MFKQFWSGMSGLLVGLAIMTTTPAGADALKDEIAPTGKLRVAIAISPAGGAFWSTKTETGYAGVPVDLGKAMAEQLGVPVEYVAHNNSGQIVDAVSKGTWDITFLPKDPEREGRMSFGLTEVADATYIVAGSAITNFATLDHPASRSPPSATRPPCAARRASEERQGHGVPDLRRNFRFAQGGETTRSRCRGINSTPWRRRFRARACSTKPSSKPSRPGGAANHPVAGVCGHVPDRGSQRHAAQGL